MRSLLLFLTLLHFSNATLEFSLPLLADRSVNALRSEVVMMFRWFQVEDVRSGANIVDVAILPEVANRKDRVMLIQAGVDFKSLKSVVLRQQGPDLLELRPVIVDGSRGRHSGRRQGQNPEERPSQLCHRLPPNAPEVYLHGSKEVKHGR